MATLTVQQISVDGLEAVFSAATASVGDKFLPSDRTLIEIVNGSGGDITATVTTPGTGPGGTAIADKVITVTAGERRHMGPFPRQDWAGSDGLATVVCSSVTSVTVAALKI